MTKTIEATFSVLAWQGTRADGTTKHLKVKEAIGIKTLIAGEVEICKNALHGSIRAVDMLQFSEGFWVKRTLHEGAISHDLDKIGSSERTVLAEIDATQLISDWAFWCADRAIRVHAVAALRQAGMKMVAEKLASLEAITDRESASAARCAALSIAKIIYGANYASCATAYIAANAVYAAAAASHAAANATVHAAADAVGQVTCAASNTAVAAADGIEMEFLNAELENRLFGSMGLTEMEITQ